MCPDITCCKWLGCNLRKYCYRFTAPKNPYQQSYFTESPKKISDESCEYMIKNTEYFKTKATPEEVQDNFNKILESNSKIYGKWYTHDYSPDEQYT